MVQPELPRTRLEQVLRERHLSVERFVARFNELSEVPLSDRQAYRWVAGRLKGLPYPGAQQTLERMFGESAARLFGPPYRLPGVVPHGPVDHPTPLRDRHNWEGQVITMSAQRARDFLSRAEASNVGPETLEQLADDVRRVATTYPRLPLPELLGDLVDVQERTFTLLEGRQKPKHTRELYLLAGISCGLLAKASHDVGASTDAMTQARTAYACAENAGHNGLRAWVRGLQSGVAYWTGRPRDAVRYAQLGHDAVRAGAGTAALYLLAAEARAWGLLGNPERARDAIRRAADVRDRVAPDELDEFGGLCTFPHRRQLYFAADALSWVAEEDAEHAEAAALEAVSAYEATDRTERGWGEEAGARAGLAVARIVQGDVEGAASALRPVLALPPTQRIHGVVLSVQRAYTALRQARLDGPVAQEVQDAIEHFARRPLASLPR
ncbi:XRE family transcriptional regulator [Gandjariella thermophila]|uniref:Uncharacterized protein n=1 Tax=Gandjariella thermophila TaxID=1931992 RepID=A0A4D4JAK5_9PSEU|nr:XRE family transcriptional regulator [Gandjariella thermophila]GDY30853.1 hypothetical protein GTS_24860 [Gandjariella thermophila]